MPTPFIRRYAPTDYFAGLHVFLLTIDPALDFDPARTIGAHLWYTPYVVLSPSTCFVLDDGAGTAVGYVISTSDTEDFSARWRMDYLPTLEAQVVPPPGEVTGDEGMELDAVRELRATAYAGACSMMLRDAEALAPWPAHLHIDVLPEYQGQRWGGRLMETLLETLRRSGCRGVHLGMARTNVRAKAFYERIGFRQYEGVLDGGVSGETGRQGDAICLVMDL